METILLIEDDKDVNLILKKALEDVNYNVISLYDGFEGINRIKTEKYDLLLLDIMLPHISGDLILKELRSFSEVPVIIISAKEWVSTKIDLLKLGADDYITKPFDVGEVVARVATNLRRKHKDEMSTNILKYKDMVLDRNEKRLFVNSQELKLTAKEYLIIELLMKNIGKVSSKSLIYELIWEEEYLGDDNVIKIHISNLRNKLKKVNEKEKYIETLWGLGYRLYKV